LDIVIVNSSVFRLLTQSNIDNLILNIGFKSSGINQISKEWLFKNPSGFSG